MAHGDTSYDDLGHERSQKTDSMTAPSRLAARRPVSSWPESSWLSIRRRRYARAAPRAPSPRARHARAATPAARCTARGVSSASVRVFKGGSVESSWR